MLIKKFINYIDILLHCNNKKQINLKFENNFK